MIYGGTVNGAAYIEMIKDALPRMISWAGFGCFLNGFAHTGNQSPNHEDQSRTQQALSGNHCKGVIR